MWLSTNGMRLNWNGMRLNWNGMRLNWNGIRLITTAGGCTANGFDRQTMNGRRQGIVVGLATAASRPARNGKRLSRSAGQDRLESFDGLRMGGGIGVGGGHLGRWSCGDIGSIVH